MLNTRDLIAWLGFFVVLGLFVSPFKDVWGRDGIYAKRSASGIATGLPYIATMFNNMLWLMYCAARPLDFVPSLLLNFLGLCLSVSYTVCYMRFTTTSDVKLCYVYLGGGACVACAAVGWYMLRGMADGQSGVGSIAALCNVLMFYAPLAALGEVMRTQSVAKMPFLPIVWSFFAGSVWFTFGVYTTDAPIMVPNGIGILFSVAQLALYATYYSSATSSSSITATYEAGVKEESP